MAGSGRSASREAAGGARVATPRSSREGASSRDRKFRQAAFVYLHVGLLYEFAVWAMWRAGAMPETRGPIALWLLVGAAIIAAIFAALWYWRNVWVARAVWALHALRLPALIGGAFFPAADAAVPPDFYLAAIPIVLVNLGFLARAGWDL
ncbi:MAG: hypothetical protein ACODAE_09650 [Gemmatimonadota bacterium]